jgi:hypothetical protein
VSARLTPYACEVRVQTLRELAPARLCDTPAKAVAFFRQNVETAPWFNPDHECAVALLLNTRRRIVGFELLGIGTKNAVLVDVGEAFRAAIVASAVRATARSARWATSTPTARRPRAAHGSARAGTPTPPLSRRGKLPSHGNAFQRAAARRSRWLPGWSRTSRART